MTASPLGQVDPVRVDLADDVSAFFTSRVGGVSLPPYDGLNLGLGVRDDPAAVLRNREAVARALGAPIVWARPVHGADVLQVGPGGVPVAAWPGGPDAPEVDALVTLERGQGLAALAADCVPVLLAAVAVDAHGTPPVTFGVAAVHSGRRGLLAGVVPAAVQALRALAREGAPGAVEVRAAVGPAVCGRCYEVPEEMRAEVAAHVPAAYTWTRSGTPALDLVAGVAEQLVAAGALVQLDGRCTLEDPVLFSHRRDGVTGRFAGVIATRRAH